MELIVLQDVQEPTSVSIGMTSFSCAGDIACNGRTRSSSDFNITCCCIEQVYIWCDETMPSSWDWTLSSKGLLDGDI